MSGIALDMSDSTYIPGKLSPAEVQLNLREMPTPGDGIVQVPGDGILQIGEKVEAQLPEETMYGVETAEGIDQDNPVIGD
jgi:hypothetical protein